MDESGLSETSTTTSSFFKAATGPKEVKKIAEAFEEAIPGFLRPIFNRKLDSWEIGRQLTGNFHLEVEITSAAGLNKLIPGDTGPYDPKNFTIFTPFLSTSPIFHPIDVNLTLISANLRSSLQDLEDLFSSLDNSLPIFFCYSNVALARADLPLNLKDSEEFRSPWETLLFGFQPEMEDQPFVKGKIRLTTAEKLPENQEGSSKRPELSSTTKNAVGSKKATLSGLQEEGNLEDTSCDSILEEIFPPEVNKNHPKITDNTKPTPELQKPPETTEDSFLEEILSSLAQKPPETKKTASQMLKSIEEIFLTTQKQQQDILAPVGLQSLEEILEKSDKKKEGREKILWRNPRPVFGQQSGANKRPDVANCCRFQLGVDRLELCGISEVEEIYISFHYPLFNLHEHNLTFTDPSLPRSLKRKPDSVAVATFSAPTAVVVDTFFHHPLILRLAGQSKTGETVGFGVASVFLSKLFEKEENLVLAGEKKVLRNQCVVSVDIEDKDEPSVILGSLDIWLCLDDSGPEVEGNCFAEGKVRKNESQQKTAETEDRLTVLEARLKKEHELAEKQWKSTNAKLRAEIASLKQKVQQVEAIKILQEEKQLKQQNQTIRELNCQLSLAKKAERERQFEVKQVQVALEAAKKENEVLKRQMSQLEADIAEIPKNVGFELKEIVRRGQIEKESLETRLKTSKEENGVLKQQLKDLEEKLKLKEKLKAKLRRKEENELNLARRALIAQEASFAALEESRVLGAIKQELLQFSKLSNSSNSVSSPKVEEKPERKIVPQHLLFLEEKLKTFLDSGVYSPEDSVILQLKEAIEEEKLKVLGS